MIALSGYIGYPLIQVITPYPEASGGRVLNDNFQIIGDLLASGDNRSNNFLWKVEDDKNPVLGNFLNVSPYPILNELGSGIYLTSPSGSWLMSGSGLDYRTYQQNLNIYYMDPSNDISYPYAPYYRRFKNIYDLNWQYIDNTYAGNNFYNIGWSTSGNTVGGNRSSILGGLYNSIYSSFLGDSVCDVDYYKWTTFARNTIIGGYNNKISSFGYHYQFPQSQEQNIILGGYENTHAFGNNTANLSTTNTINHSGIVDNTYYTGNSPFTSSYKSRTHGFAAVDGYRGGFKEKEIFCWGVSPKNSSDTWYAESGMIVDMYGRNRTKAPEDKFVFLYDLDERQAYSNYLNSYELFCAISASGDDGRIHTAAWAPIHLKYGVGFIKVFIFGTWMTFGWGGVVQSGDIITGFYPTPTNNNYVVNSLKESGCYGLTNEFVYWYPSSYNNGLSGLMTIYAEEDYRINSAYQYDDDYKVIENGWNTGTGTDLAGYSPHTGSRLVIQFRLHESSWKGFNACVWMRGMSLKGIFSYTPTY